MNRIRCWAWTFYAVLLILASQAAGAHGAENSFPKWAKIELTFAGPESRGTGEPNPFGIRMDVDFRSPNGKTFRVPAFYDGDGRGGLDGNVWKVRLSADLEGEWTFRTTSENDALNSQTGTFEITQSRRNAKGFWKWGRLEYIGTAENKIRYLKFRDGPFWLKAGCDDPENFLGKYRNYDTLEKRKAAVDYLAERGVNSLYIMTHNIDGDDRDVWPWLGDSPREAKANGEKNARFDVVKLDEWRALFEHMQDRGVVPYLILEDDSAWKGYDHERYYREMIARFGYLPALLFNFGEEHNENYRLAEALDYMKLLDEIDPYDHPRGIHNVNRPTDEYIDAAHIHFTSIQTGSPGSRRGLDNALEHNLIAIEWLRRCESRSRRMLMLNFDEGRPEEHRAAWWAAYLAGGVWEAHVLQPYDRPLSAWQTTWTQIGGTRRFMESLPFWEMNADNGLVKDGRALCLAKPGAAYALYLPEGNAVAVDLQPEKQYRYAWWNPANGQSAAFQDEGRCAGGVQRFTPPSDGDWALRIIAE